VPALRRSGGQAVLAFAAWSTPIDSSPERDTGSSHSTARSTATLVGAVINLLLPRPRVCIASSYLPEPRSRAVQLSRRRPASLTAGHPDASFRDITRIPRYASPKAPPPYRRTLSRSSIEALIATSPASLLRPLPAGHASRLHSDRPSLRCPSRVAHIVDPDPCRLMIPLLPRSGVTKRLGPLHYIPFSDESARGNRLVTFR
jgi:hypothetical protein